MGNSFSDWAELRVLDMMFGNTGAYVPSATAWLALFTTPPTDSTTGVELNGGGYARVAIQHNTSIWPGATTGAKTNGTGFEFPTATTAWGNVSAFAFFDASVGGDMLVYGTASAVKNIASGDVCRFPSGSITISLN
jgi:hypothetical protein